MTATTAPVQEQQRSAKDPLRFHLHYHHRQGKEGGDSPYAGGSSFMERVSEAVASGMGTVAFLVISSASFSAGCSSTTSSSSCKAPGTGC